MLRALRVSIFPRAIVIVLAISLLGVGACAEKSASAPTPAPPTDDKTKPTDFDGKRAFDLVRKQVDFGPHPAGSPAIKEVQKFIIAELKSYGLNVKTQSFKPNTPHGPVEMLNIIGELAGEKTDRIIIS